MKNRMMIWGLLFSMAFTGCGWHGRTDHEENVQYDGKAGLSRTLVIIWTTADKETASQVVLEYPLNAKINGWIESVKVYVWGPSVQLLASDKDIQNLVKGLTDAGVSVEVSESSIEKYGLTQRFKELGLDVNYLGKSLTSQLAEGSAVLTF